MLNQIMDQAARARCTPSWTRPRISPPSPAVAVVANLQCVKPEKAEMITSMLLQMARQGRLPGQVNEAMLKDLLAQVSESVDQKSTIKVGAAVPWRRVHPGWPLTRRSVYSPPNGQRR